MSNPAVFRLNKLKIRQNVISIEDNIGESIHFHLGLVRFDLSISEFNNITHKLISVLNTQINIEKFNLFQQNEYFLERIALALPYITEVEEVTVNIENLKILVEKDNEIVDEVYIKNSPVYQYYKGNSNSIKEYDIKREIWQTKEQLLEEVRKKYNDMIYIDSNNRILDGYKSMCAKMAVDDIHGAINVKKIVCSDSDKLKYILFKEKQEW